MNKELPFIIPSAKSAMETAIASQGLVRQFGEIFEQYPVLRTISLALAKHFLRIVPNSKRSAPLLDVCLQTAAEYFYLHEFKDSRLCFIRGLMLSTPDVLFWSVYINRRFDGPVCWDCVEQSLCDWMVENLRPPEIAFRHELQHSIITPSSYRELLSYRLVPSDLVLELSDIFHVAYSEQTLVL